MSDPARHAALLSPSANLYHNKISLAQYRSPYQQPQIQLHPTFAQSYNPRPANHLHDICADADWRPEATGPHFGRGNHSPLRSPPRAPTYNESDTRLAYNNHSPVRYSQNNGPFHLGSVRSSRHQLLDAGDVTNPDSVTLQGLAYHHSSSSPLRRNSKSNSPDFRDNHNGS